MRVLAPGLDRRWPQIRPHRRRDGHPRAAPGGQVPRLAGVDRRHGQRLSRLPDGHPIAARRGSFTRFAISRGSSTVVAQHRPQRRPGRSARVAAPAAMAISLAFYLVVLRRRNWSSVADPRLRPACRRSTPGRCPPPSRLPAQALRRSPEAPAAVDAATRRRAPPRTRAPAAPGRATPRASWPLGASRYEMAAKVVREARGGRPGWRRYARVAFVKLRASRR